MEKIIGVVKKKSGFAILLLKGKCVFLVLIWTPYKGGNWFLSLLYLFSSGNKGNKRRQNVRQRRGEKTPKKQLILAFFHNFQIKRESIHSFLLLFLPNVLLIVSHPPANATVCTFCRLLSLVPNPQGQVQPIASFGAAGRSALPILSRSSGAEIPLPNTDKALNDATTSQIEQETAPSTTSGFSRDWSLT